MGLATAIAGSALLGGISSAASGSASRRAAKDSNAAVAAENEKQRQHEMALKQFDVDRRKSAVSKWSQYDFGAKPLIRRAAPSDSVVTEPESMGAAAPVREDPGLLERYRRY